MNEQYSIEEWAAGTTRGRQMFNYNYRMLGNEIKGWKLIKVVTLREDSDVTQKAYLWQSRSDPEREMIRVDITERHNWRLAQESLLEYLMQCMRPDIPRGSRNLAQLGDVVFVGRSPQTDMPGAVSFTRGNVFVTVSSSGEKDIDVSGAAAPIDRILSEAPARRDVDKGKARVLRPRTATVRANESQVLIDNLEKAAKRGEWLKIIVPDGEIARRDNSLTYVSGEGGKKEVNAFAIGGG